MVLFISTGSDINPAAPSSLSELFSYIFAVANKAYVNVNCLPNFLDSLLAQMPLAVAGLPLIAICFFRKRTFDVVGLILSAVLHLWFLSAVLVPSNVLILSEWATKFYGPLSLYAVVSLAAVIGWIVETRVIKIMIGVAVLIPTIYVLPLSLAAADARRDLSLAAELEAIVKEVPPGAIFISSADRTSMGLHYMRETQNKGKDIILIVEKLLDNKKYVESLSKKYSLFQGLDLEGHLSIDEIVGLAARYKQPVYSYYETKPPDAYVGLPIGVTVQWLRKNMPVHYRDTVERLVGFCARWPEVLSYTNFSRPSSEVIKHKVFLSPIKRHLKVFGDSPLAPPLHAAIREFKRARVGKAREICAKALKKNQSS